jgi:excisionase family DNA binding protein
MFDKEFIDAIAVAVVDKIMERMPAAQFGGKRLMNIKEAAAYIGRTEDAVYQLIHRRRLPAIKEGRRVHIDRDDLEQFIERNRLPA